MAAFTALALALIAVAIAIVAWFRPAHQNAAPRFSEHQTAQAKSNVCSVFTTVREGVVTNTHLAEPNDPIGQLAVAANARLSLLGGGAYLADRVGTEPATPADLTKAVNSMANTMQQMGAGFLAGETNAVLDPLRQSLDSQIEQITKLCE